MGKLLNIDEILGEPRTVSWQGKEYKVLEPTLAIRLEIEKGDDDLEGMSKVLGHLVPGLELDTVPIRALPALFRFVLGDDTADEKKTAETKTGEK